ncbi:MAG: CpaF family protein, partial [Oricola sp.]|nr:CpaF family protein [Oricola sp.]
MFGRRTGPVETAAPKPAAAQQKPAPRPAAAAAKPAAPKPSAPKAAAKSAPPAPPRVAAPSRKAPETVEIGGRSDEYFQTKTTIFNALIDTIDLSQLA